MLSWYAEDGEGDILSGLAASWIPVVTYVYRSLTRASTSWRFETVPNTLISAKSSCARRQSNQRTINWDQAIDAAQPVVEINVSGQRDRRFREATIVADDKAKDKMIRCNRYQNSQLCGSSSSLKRPRCVFPTIVACGPANQRLDLAHMLRQLQ